MFATSSISVPSHTDGSPGLSDSFVLPEAEKNNIYIESQSCKTKTLLLFIKIVLIVMKPYLLK